MDCNPTNQRLPPRRVFMVITPSNAGSSALLLPFSGCAFFPSTTSAILWYSTLILPLLPLFFTSKCIAAGLFSRLFQIVYNQKKKSPNTINRPLTPTLTLTNRPNKYNPILVTPSLSTNSTHRRLLEENEMFRYPATFREREALFARVTQSGFIPPFFEPPQSKRVFFRIAFF